MSEGLVYFIQSGADGPIKIGYTANLEGRLAAMSTASPVDLRVLAAVPGNARAERFVHDAVASSRRRAEWFSPTEEVLRLIEDVRRYGAGVFPPGCEASRKTSNELERQRNQEILLVCQEYVRCIAYPRGLDETKSDIFARVARTTGISARMIKSVWYGEDASISAFVLLTLRKHFSARVEHGLDSTELADEGEKK